LLRSTSFASATFDRCRLLSDLGDATDGTGDCTGEFSSTGYWNDTFPARRGLVGGESCEKALGVEDKADLRTGSGADDMRLWQLPSEWYGLVTKLDLLSTSAAGPSTSRTEFWCASVAAELSMMRERNDSGEEKLRSFPRVSESTLILFGLSVSASFLCTSRCSGSSGCEDCRCDCRLGERSGVGDSSLKAMFRPEWRSVCLRRGGVTMILASTTVEPTDDVECLLLVSSRGASSRGFSSRRTLSSLGHPIDCAKFSIDGVTGLFVLASTRSRRPDVRRGRGLGLVVSMATIWATVSCELSHCAWDLCSIPDLVSSPQPGVPCPRAHRPLCLESSARTV
jgi:hypothetical protein